MVGQYAAPGAGGGVGVGEGVGGGVGDGVGVGVGVGESGHQVPPQGPQVSAALQYSPGLLHEVGFAPHPS